MIQILTKEFNSFLNSLIAYVVMCVFLASIGLITWVFPETSVLDYGYADMYTFFSLSPYVFLFLVPAITMRSFAEEKKSGTIELLLTKPLTDWDIVLGKYFACFYLVLLSILPTILYYFSIASLGNPVGNMDSSAVIGSYIGLVLLASVFCAVGVFSSAITNNQIISFIVSAFLCYLFLAGFESIALFDIWGNSALFVKQLGILYHYDALSRGVIDSRDVMYFLSLVFIFLLFTRTSLSSRSW
jgi:ABC-2 type transport system permease protein